jgi:S-adenosylmethionine:tRNA ribosyltransferase-isomerase
VRLDELDYDLPVDRIAQEPSARREDARLLVLDRVARGVVHRGVGDLPELLRPGDVLVVNDTRVLAARLIARRRTGGRVEVFLVERRGDAWEALVRAGGRLEAGELLVIEGAGAVRLEESLGQGRWRVRGEGTEIEALMAHAGRMPLPPYIRREDEDPRADLDRERYQTTFARVPGAIAAPTAGLHLTPELVGRIEASGVEIARLTLHVGLGTFEPVRTERLEDHVMHEERYEIPPETAAAVRRAKAKGGRVVAVGTTCVRALEDAAGRTSDDLPESGVARTRLLILPGYRFRVVDALLTNFHLPRSTLLALVAAFAGRERVLAAYEEAVREGYRFFSYGDAMFLA